MPPKTLQYNVELLYTIKYRLTILKKKIHIPVTKIIQAKYMTTHSMPSLVRNHDVALIWMNVMRCGAGKSDALRVAREYEQLQERKKERQKKV